MKLLYVFLSVLSVSLGHRNSNTTCVCGWRNNGRIVGGQETKKNEYPWMAYIGGCGGSIITEWHVLTAAHCTLPRKAEDIIVSVGRHNRDVYRDTNSQDYRVSSIINHREFTYRGASSDISILVLSQPITFNRYIGPVCLPNRRINLEGQYAKAMGWGRTKDTGDRTFLREADLMVIPLDECRKSWDIIRNDGRHMCTFDDNRRKSTCIGDSGGPLVYLDPVTNRYTLAGVVSIGPDNCQTIPTVNTEVSFFMDWINHAVASTKPSARVCI